MLKTLDILIGTTTVVLVFSMAVTVITGAITTMVGRRGKHLKAGLADLLQQLGIPERQVSETIAHAVLTHPLLSEGKAWWGWGKERLGTVVSREEFTKVLLGAAASLSPDASGQSGTLWSNLDNDAKQKLVTMLQSNGVSDPQATLKNVRAMALQLEASNPELAADVRQSLALIHEAGSDYVARVNSWFDQTIERVGQRFAKYTHYVTLFIATLVVLAVQLDVIAVVDRLSVDDVLRNQIAETAMADEARFAGQPAPDHPPAAPAQSQPATNGSEVPSPNLSDYYNQLSGAGLVTLPFGYNWGGEMRWRKVPGMVLATLLISLGAPFWYNVLKDLLGLRASLAKKDDVQRLIRQTTQDAPSPAGEKAAAVPLVLAGERGDLNAVG
jgi:hypothetical protein